MAAAMVEIVARMQSAVAFDDLGAAGRALADALTVYGTDRRALVLGIVRGGVRAAFEVARTLDLPLDVVLLKALVTRASGGLLRAASVAGTLVVDEGCHTQTAGSIERLVVDDGIGALMARGATCRGPRPAERIADRTILLVDNGLRTGQTMAAAIRAVRALNPGRVVVATPVGAASAVALVGALADQLHCLVTPASLGNVAMAYQHFDVPDESHIRGLLERATDQFKPRDAS
jgi:putative phosphoribosyl transferase